MHGRKTRGSRRLRTRVRQARMRAHRTSAAPSAVPCCLSGTVRETETGGHSLAGLSPTGEVAQVDAVVVRVDIEAVAAEEPDEGDAESLRRVDGEVGRR